jgi:hypothetical protein
LRAAAFRRLRLPLIPCRNTISLTAMPDWPSAEVGRDDVNRRDSPVQALGILAGNIGFPIVGWNSDP